MLLTILKSFYALSHVTAFVHTHEWEPTQKKKQEKRGTSTTKKSGHEDNDNLELYTDSFFVRLTL